MIAQNVPELSGNETKYVLDCLETNWLSSTGPYVEKFEKAFAEYCGVPYAVACSNGTTALHLAMLAAGVGIGDEVLVPDFTLIADSNMVMLAGAKPVFVDIDPETWCIDPAKAEEKITPRTKAILCVHMFGHPCDMHALRRLADEHSLVLIEDAAQAHGSIYDGQVAGSLGDLSCFSFYATKTLTTGEGGLVLTKNKEIDHKLRLLRSHGFEGAGRTYIHTTFGYNYRLTNLQAAIGLAQVEQLEEKAQKKCAVFSQYQQRLAEIPGIVLQRSRENVRNTYWNVVIVLEDEFGHSAAALMDILGQHSIQTRQLFQPLHGQPLYHVPAGERVFRDEVYPDCSGAYPVSDWLATRGVSLPSSIGLSTSDIEKVCEVIAGARG